MSLPQVYGDLRSLLAQPDCTWMRLCEALNPLPAEHLNQVGPYTLDAFTGVRYKVVESYKELMSSSDFQRAHTQAINLSEKLNVTESLRALSGWGSLKYLHIDSSLFTAQTNLLALKDLPHLEMLNLYLLPLPFYLISQSILGISTLNHLQVKGYSRGPLHELPRRSSIVHLPQITKLDLYSDDVIEGFHYMLWSFEGVCLANVHEVRLHVPSVPMGTADVKARLDSFIMTKARTSIFPNLKVIDFSTLSGDMRTVDAP